MAGATKQGEDCPRHLAVELRGVRMLLEGDMAYAVAYDANSGVKKSDVKLEDEDVDWELLDVPGTPDDQRVISISINKYQPFDRLLLVDFFFVLNVTVSS